jgi:hypothetical protein
MLHNTSRNCTRCGKDLTDAASMEAGIGPICRHLDNELLARLIPSDVEAARKALEAVDVVTAAPETVSTLTEVCDAVYADEAMTREDWRIEVKRVEWALSFPANNAMRDALTGMVAALGYVGLAALWNGDAATGEAAVFFANGRLLVQGPKNKAARMAFREIKGFKFHAEGTLAPASKAAWSFPADQHGAFFRAIITHYPNFTGLMEAVQAAKAFLAAPQPTVAAAPVAVKAKDGGTVVVAPVVAEKPAPKCSMTVAGLFVKVATPYKVEFIGDLKQSFPYSDRRWNKFEKVWEVVATHQTKVVELVKKHYGADALGTAA